MATSSSDRKKNQIARDKDQGISTFNVRAYDEDKEAIKKFAKWLFEQRAAEKQKSQANNDC